MLLGRFPKKLMWVAINVHCKLRKPLGVTSFFRCRVSGVSKLMTEDRKQKPDSYRSIGFYHLSSVLGKPDP